VERSGSSLSRAAGREKSLYWAGRDLFGAVRHAGGPSVDDHILAVCLRASHVCGVIALVRRWRGAESVCRLGPSVLIADAADPVDRWPTGVGSGTRVRSARWRTPAATPGRARCSIPRGHTCPGGRHGRRLAHWVARARRPRRPARLQGCGSFPGAGGARQRGGADRAVAALMRGGIGAPARGRAGGASLASSPAAACRKPGGARLLHAVSAFGAACLRRQDCRFAPAAPPPFRRRLRCFGRRKGPWVSKLRTGRASMPR
jgi:hypothetical protein